LFFYYKEEGVMSRSSREKTKVVIMHILAVVILAAPLSSAEEIKDSHDLGFAPCSAASDLQEWLNAESRYGAPWAPYGMRDNIEVLQEVAAEICSRAPKSGEAFTKDRLEWFLETEALISSLTTDLVKSFGKELTKGEQQRIGELAVVLRNFQQNFSATRALIYASVVKDEQKPSSGCSVLEANESR
jgi:hypothetical protein